MKLKEWIEKEHKTQQEVADAIGVAQGQVSAWCSGDKMPRPDNVRKIVEITHGEVQPNDFYKNLEE